MPIKEIDPGLPELSDRELIVALHRRGWPTLVTANYKIVRNPGELAAILGTKSTLVAIESVGDDMLRATGALLLDLPAILPKIVQGKAQVFLLRPRTPSPKDAWDYFKEAAGRLKRDPTNLYAEVRLRPEETDQHSATT